MCVLLFQEEAQKHAYSLRGNGNAKLDLLDTCGGKQFLFRKQIFFYSGFTRSGYMLSGKLFSKCFPSPWVVTLTEL